MELSKDDIVNVAYQRFNKRHWKRFFGILIGWFVVFIVVILAVPVSLVEESWQVGLAILLPMAVAMLISMYFFYNRPQSRYVKAVVEECKANPALTYVPNPTKEAREIIK